MSTPQSLPGEPISDREKHRRAQLYARLTYGLIIVVFVAVCGVAVVASMAMERDRQGFRPIQVSKPIAFFDDSAVNKDKRPAQ